MIRVVNLMIGLPSTINLHRRRRTSYEPDGPRPVYILEKNCKSDGGVRFTFANENVNQMAPHTVYILKKIVNQTRDIQFSIFFLAYFRKQKFLLIIFTETILTF